MNKVYLMSFVLVLFIGAESYAGNRHHDITWFSVEAGNSREDNFDWQNKGPLDLIEFLKAEYNNRQIPIYTVWSYHRGWIKESDIPALRALLESKQPCAALQNPVQSYISSGSTVGVVAKQLIDGFDSGGFPTWNAWLIRKDAGGKKQ